MERRRTFSREFKLEAVKLVTERGVAVVQAAKDLDVHENVLRKEVAKLKMERDILKKAAACRQTLCSTPWSKPCTTASPQRML